MSDLQPFEFIENSVFKNNTVWNGDPTHKNLVNELNESSTSISFTNSNSIAIPAANSMVDGGGPANPYSSNIRVTGLNGTITDLNVKIHNFSHTYPKDVAILLVAPTGENFMLQSDTGGTADVNNITYTFDDQATATISGSGQFIANNSFVKPTSIGNDDILLPPAPYPPYNHPAPADSATLNGIFGGLNPNGTWKLFVFDFFAGNSGTISGGWSLDITTTTGAALPSITSLNPSNQIAGGANFNLTIDGNNFKSDSVVRWNGQNKATTFVSSSQLKAQILASDIQTAGLYPVAIVNSLSGEVSNSANFSVVDCSYSLNSASSNYTNTGGVGTVNITTTSGCSWTATTSANWITFTGISSGTGTRTISFTVLQNTGSSRNATITVGGQTFTVNQAAASLFNISGFVTYGVTTSEQNPQYVSGVNFNAVGTTSVSVASDTSGFYQLSGLPAGNYTVTAQKSSDTNGINSLDAARIQQYLVGLTNFTENQLAAADVDNNGLVNSVDAARIQQHLVGIDSATAIGQWKFMPASRQYNSITANFTSENYQAVLVGEVSGNWTDSTSAANVEYSGIEEDQSIAGKNDDQNVVDQDPAELVLRKMSQTVDSTSTTRSILKSNEQQPDYTTSLPNEIEVSLPANAFSSNGTVVTIPVAVSDLTNTSIEGFNFTVFYNSNVLMPVSGNTASNAGTLSDGCSVIGNSPVAGQMKVSGSCTFPINAGSGTLVNLRFNVVGSGGQRTQLLFNDPAVPGSTDTVQINSGSPQTRTNNGSFTVTGPTAASVSVSGRVTTASGKGIRNVLVTLIDSSGNARVARTISFGYYNFNDVEVGKTFLISATSKQFIFAQPVQVININEALTNIDFIAEHRFFNKF